MRWFKHMTDVYFNQKMSAIEDELGLIGSGMFWRIMEVVASQLDEKLQTFAEHSAISWGKYCRLSAKKFQKNAEILEKYKLIILEKTQNGLRINIPNILDYLDESTKKKIRNSGTAPEEVRNDSGPQQNRTEEKKEETPPLPPSRGAGGGQDPPEEEFQAFRKAYPKEGGERAVRREWERVRKKGASNDDLLKAITRHRARAPNWQKSFPQYVEDPAKWLRDGLWRRAFPDSGSCGQGQNVPKFVPKPDLTPEEKAEAGRIAKEFLEKRGLDRKPQEYDP